MKDDIKKPNLTRRHRASARRVRQRIHDIWRAIETCEHTTPVYRIVPATLTDQGDHIDQLVVKRCANRVCNEVLGYE